MSRLVLTLAALAAFLAAAAPARAAEVWVGPPNPYYYYSGLVVNVRAWPGEPNRVTFTVAPDGRSAMIRDTGATPVAGAGCVSAAPDTVTCASSPAAGIGAGTVDLGDLGDSAVVRLPTSARWEDFGIHGGAGDDTLDLRQAGLLDQPHAGPTPAGAFGDAGNDLLLAGPRGSFLGGGTGNDRLRGAGGPDSLDGGAGADRIAGGPGNDTANGGSGSDVIDGGTGRDGAGYDGHHHGVTVDLAVDRERGFHERDALRRIEDVEGTWFHDVLRGDAGPNEIHASSSSSGSHGAGDLIESRGGNDLIWDFAGASRIRAGAGNDSLHGLAKGDRADCGPGRDQVRESFKGVKLTSCEDVPFLATP